MTEGRGEIEGPMTSSSTPTGGGAGGGDPDRAEAPDPSVVPMPEDLKRAPPSEATRPVSAGSSAPTDPFGKFEPGLVINGRYRVTSKVGAGAMGEVYRAEDLRVGQEVALKFLPAAFSADEDRRRRFINELKSARKVSHPNVCRVHDLGEYGGRFFLSMEYVDGDDLTTLLRRVGRLPEERAIEMARQLCAGLEAAHRAGVLHRDLKPGNVMIDGQGRVRVLDFGLAAAANEVRGAEIRAGTPAFMAPEQLAGSEVSVRSDIYALGLVMYQMFTGRPAFRAGSVHELREQQQASRIQDPSALIETLDPVVGQVILRCLEPDPARRPVSALEIARQLPGGDPLEAALAAGETPAPELVAAAGAGGGLSGAMVAGVLALMAVAVGLAVWFQQSVSMIEVSPLRKSAPVLAYDAERMLRSFGYGADPKDRAYAFDFYEEYIREIRQKDQSDDRWERLAHPRPAAIDFWYRQSPQVLRPLGPTARVTMTDPPMSTPGEIAVRLSPLGQLRELVVYTRSDEQEASPWAFGGAPPPPPDAGPLFEAAQLDLDAFEEVDPRRLPGVSYDQRRAWTGVYPESPDIPIRVEAAWLAGKPVAFRLIETRWPGASIAAPDQGWIPGAQQRLIGAAFLGALVVAAVALARVNLRQRRGDRRGAFRLALVVALLEVVAGVFSAHLPPDAMQILTAFSAVAGSAVVKGALIWVFYIALEPHVRRLWPQTLISWTRLMEGRARDPLVGEHLLVGALLGCTAVLTVTLAHFAWKVTGTPPAAPHVDPAGVLSLNGPRASVAAVAEILSRSLLVSAPILMGVVLLRLWLRRTWLAAVLFAAAQGAVWSAQFESWNLGVLVLLLGLAGLVVFAAVRCGLLTVVAASCLYLVLMGMPLTLRADAWYIASTVLTLSAVAAIVVASSLFAMRSSPGAVSRA